MKLTTHFSLLTIFCFLMLDLSAFGDGLYIVHLTAEEQEGRLVMKVMRR